MGARGIIAATYDSPSGLAHIHPPARFVCAPDAAAETIA
jgi:hypothetical protein